MTLTETIKRAIVHNDAKAAAVVVDVCRFRGGMNYDETLARVQRQYPALEPADWDALLYEADRLHP